MRDVDTLANSDLALLTGWQGGLLLALLVWLAVIAVVGMVRSHPREDVDAQEREWTAANSIDRRPGRRP